MFHEDPGNVSYSAVDGLSDQIRELMQSIELPLMNPELFISVGIKPPKGVLFYGPPGTGKKFLARAIASNIAANFLKLWVYTYFTLLAPVSVRLIELSVPCSRYYNSRFEQRCLVDCTFQYFRRFFDTITADQIDWHPWADIPHVSTATYTSVWHASTMRILFEGPFGRVFYLGERFIRQTRGVTNPDISHPPLADMRVVDDLPNSPELDPLMIGEDGDRHHELGDFTTFLRTRVMAPLTPGVVRAVPEVAVALAAGPGDAPIGDGVIEQIPLKHIEKRDRRLVFAPSVEQIPRAYGDELLRTIDRLLIMVRRRQTTLVTHEIELQPALAVPAGPSATSRRRWGPMRGR